MGADRWCCARALTGVTRVMQSATVYYLHIGGGAAQKVWGMSCVEKGDGGSLGEGSKKEYHYISPISVKTKI